MFEKEIEDLFYELSEKVEADHHHRQQESLLDKLAALPGIDRKTLIEIDKAIFLSEMRAIEIACREAFISGINYCN